MVSASLVKELREATGAGMLDCKKALEECNGSIEEATTWLREKGISKAAKKSDRIAAEGLASVLIEGNTAVVVEINSETDFVAKNEAFVTMVNVIAETILKSNVESVEDANALETSDGVTIEQLVINNTAKIGEKLSFRRFEKITKNDNQAFGSYLHMGGKIAVLTVLNDTTDEVAKDVAMHAAAMNPIAVKREDVSTELIAKEREIAREIAINEGKKEEMLDKIVDGKINKFYKDSCLEEQMFIKDDSLTVAKYVANNGGSVATMIRFAVGEGIEKKEENFAEEVAKQIKG